MCSKWMEFTEKEDLKQITFHSHLSLAKVEIYDALEKGLNTDN